MRISINAAVVLFVSSIAFGATYYVPDDFATIQAALDDIQVKDKDTVIVRPGTYNENIIFNGKEILLKSEKGPGQTVIDGQKKDTVVMFYSGEGPDAVLDGFTIFNGHAQDGGGIVCVLYSSPSIKNNIIRDNTSAANGAGILCAESDPLIENNVIQDNIASGDYGGGIFCSSSKATILNNTISGNSSGWESGGIFCGGFSAPLIDGNEMFDNSAYMGGAIFCCMSSPTITNNYIHHNYGEAAAGGICSKNHSAPLIAHNLITDNRVDKYYGGGIFCATSAPVITHNVILGNSADQGGGICCGTLPSQVLNNVIAANTAASEGGGIFCKESNSTYANNIIYGNKASSGGGIYCFESSPLVSNNTIHGNEALNPAGGIGCDAPSTPSVQNCILWGNIPDEIDGIACVLYCCVEGGWAGPGNIKTDPKFLDPIKGDFHLSYESPCRNCGNNYAPPYSDYDCEGDPRIADGIIDMGADEFHAHLYCTGDATPGGTIELKVIGNPTASPVLLWMGSGILEVPLKTSYGEWYLEFPLLVDVSLGLLSPHTGALELPYTFPPDFPAPWTFPLQSFAGDRLTNLCALQVE